MTARRRRASSPRQLPARVLGRRQRHQRQPQAVHELRARPGLRRRGRRRLLRRAAQRRARPRPGRDRPVRDGLHRRPGQDRRARRRQPAGPRRAAGGVRAPASVARRDRRAVETIQIAPTILNLLGLDPQLAPGSSGRGHPGAPARRWTGCHRPAGTAADSETWPASSTTCSGHSGSTPQPVGPRSARARGKQRPLLLCFPPSYCPSRPSRGARVRQRSMPGHRPAANGVTSTSPDAGYPRPTGHTS